ncbi:hypothetical protein BG006_006747 [Podila minutissima]|uniref:FAD-binding domain-containing protein n=1 Tax=Podila minutissima TaxID=64525 RepID=A0A9P5SIK8_9FUNG|nr:hypothetical protein BG006_006747 [Podila minutissima]
MAPAQFKVVIVGGGIAGLALGVMLERAGIDYIILEATQEIRPMGAVVYLGPPLMRAMEQLGLLDDLIRNSNTMTGVTLMNHRLTKICRVNIAYAAERYGHATLTILRPKLYDILLSRIPAYRILFGKRVIQSFEGAEGITVRCEDGTTHHGDILVGADGGASPVRERIHQDIRRSFATSTSKAAKRSLHRSDYAPPRVEQQCIVGITEPLASKTYPVLASKSCELVMIMPKETNCMIWLVPMAGNRFGWGVTTTLPPPPDSQLPNKSVDSDDKNNNNNNTNNHRRCPTERASLESKFNLRTSPSKHHYRHHSADFDFYLATSTPPSSPVESYKPEFPLSGQVSSRSLSKKTSRRDVKSTYSAGYEPNLRSEPLHYSSSLVRPSGEAVAIARLPYASTSTTRPSFQHKTSMEMETGGASASKGASVQPFTLHSANATSNRTWRRLDEMFTVDGSIRHQPSPHGGTLGDLVDSTSRKMISVVVVEEKFYHTWHHGRSILIGDACHMILTSSGHGTTQAILDAMSLATLLTELPSKTPEDIEALFQVHYERRAPIAKAAVTISKHQDQLLYSRNFSGKFIRKMSSNWMSDWIKIRVGDRLFDRRPMLPFLKPVPSRGTCRNKDAPVPFLQEKKFIETEAARRRKSVSSEYSATSAYSFNRDGSTSPASSPVTGGGNQSPFASTNSNASNSSSSALDDPDRQRRRAKAPAAHVNHPGRRRLSGDSATVPDPGYGTPAAEAVGGSGGRGDDSEEEEVLVHAAGSSQEH